MLDIDSFFPQFIVDKITDIRIHDPERAVRIARTRKMRERITENGRLSIVSADHSSRGAADSPAMANRREYLMRIVRLLLGNTIDGVIASIDLLEELLIIHDWVLKAAGPPLLHQKLLIPNLNPGGTAFLSTGLTAENCKDWRMDGANLVIGMRGPEADMPGILSQYAQVISSLNSLDLLTFLRIVPPAKSGSGQRKYSAADLLPILSVAVAMGGRVRNLWLQVAYCSGYETLARATTFPILWAASDLDSDPLSLLQQIAGALKCAGNVRGAMVDRHVLFPGHLDPLLMARAVDGIVHREWTMEDVRESLSSEEDLLEGLNWSEILRNMREVAENSWFTFENI